MLLHILLQDIQVLLTLTQIAKLIVIFLTDGREDRLKVLDQTLRLAHLSHLRLLLLIGPDILISSAGSLLNIDAALRNNEFDEMVDLSQIEALRKLLRARQLVIVLIVVLDLVLLDHPRQDLYPLQIVEDLGD